MIRGVDLRGALAINAISMIGIGPLITIPLVLMNLHGPLSLAGWIFGALLALCDGLVWAELGSQLPGSGGTYGFLREAFGKAGLGKMLAFLFAWQTLFSAPLNLATGYIGFANYASYLVPALAQHRIWQGLLAVCVGLATIGLLYRRIGNVARISIAFGVIGVTTLALVAAAAYGHFDAARAFTLEPGSGFGPGFLAGLGSAMVITMYDYLGYNQAASLGDEIRTPSKTLPRAIVGSILGIAALYITLQIGVLGAISWHELVPPLPGAPAPDGSQFVASTVVLRSWGPVAAAVLTLAILVTAFASTFGCLLGYSRIPYAAALDGVFLAPFARLHPSGRFPNVSLLAMGLLALPACFVSLDTVISALTTGMVIIQSFGGIASLFALRARARNGPAPVARSYRMWLYPVPALIALVGWTAIFFSAGPGAIAFGLLTLCAGTAVYMLWARRAAVWPFAATAGLVLLAFACTASPAAAAEQLPGFTSSAIVERDGAPVFTVDGKPFFVYGAAFFYERLPRSQWSASMRELRTLGINTLDLYVMWNWHELSDGDFDFTGRTSPRRDLREVLRLARAYGFKLIVRPGPVIRNEWRNGGYPAWLLERPEYGMPLHDLLEGRYPPTATLQNAHSDAAAAQWMANATHVRSTRRWLERALAEFAPVADRVIAVQLDDDQAAYIDNDTWPAPHLREYLEWLRDVVHGVTGAQLPTFINTFQMKVTAAAPVWAWGNWYQSDTFAIGEHDRAQLEFSTALLGTQPHRPVMASEFQAGWLQQPDDIYPRAADPANTLLALHTMLAQNARGVVNFPVQDTLAPAGMEAPFSNAFYAWDAALTLDRRQSPRYAAVKRFGDTISTFGSALAASRTVADAAIVYATSALDERRATNAAIADIASHTIEAQQACRRERLACELIDLRFIESAALARYPILFFPLPAGAESERRALDRSAAANLDGYARHGGYVVRGTATPAAVAAALAATGHLRVVEGLPDAVFARSSDPAYTGFVIAVNYDDKPRSYANVRIHASQDSVVTLPSVALGARDANVIPVPATARHDAAAVARPNAAPIAPPKVAAVVRPSAAVASQSAAGVTRPGAAAVARPEITSVARPSAAEVGGSGRRDSVPKVHGGARGDGLGATIALRGDVRLTLPAAARRTVAVGTALAFTADVYEDGMPAFILQNALVRIVVSPAAGARAFAFEDVATGDNAFTTVGALRDDVALEPPLSTTDRIARYTHDFPAGTFNRSYACTPSDARAGEAALRCTYDAPDVIPHGARFERTLRLAPGERVLAVEERATFTGTSAELAGQHAVTVSSLAAGGSRTAAAAQIVLAPEPQPFVPLSRRRVERGNALGLYDPAARRLVALAWHPGDIVDAQILERRSSIVVRLTRADALPAHTYYTQQRAETLEKAQTALAALAARAARVAGGKGPM